MPAHRKSSGSVRIFIQSPSEHYLITLFQKKIDAFSNLSVDEKIAYQKRNEAAVTGYVLPAYETLIKGLTELLGKGQNEQGLFYFPKGQAFYEYLVKREVGDSRSIAQIEEEIKQQLVADYQAIQNRLQAAPHTTSASSQPSAAAASVSGLSTAALPALTFLSGISTDPGMPASFADDSTDAVAMLKDLRKKISQDFPDIPAVSCEVKYIDDSLKDYLSPAFYLTPPIDQYTENVIYLNPAENCRGLSLYTTLAHEGYPGHLFQTVSFHAQSPAPLRFLLAPGGYTEGWATYVEMYALSLWDGGDAWLFSRKTVPFSFSGLPPCSILAFTITAILCRCLCISDKASWIQRFRSLLPLPGDSAGSGQLSAILCRLPEFSAPSQYHAGGIAGTLRTTRFSYSGTRCRSCAVFYSGEAGRSKAWGDSFITRSF